MKKQPISPYRQYLSLLCLIVGLLCLWYAIPLPKSVVTSDSQRSVQLITTNIEDIRIGDRTLGANPFREQVDNAFEPDSTWKLVKLQLTKEAGKLLDVELLRPIEWLEGEEAKIGSTIYLDLPEMGAVGDASVISVLPAPPIQQGQGNVVTGRFIHQAANCIDLYIEGQDNPIGCTDNHPFWSEDRQDFIPAGQLNQGERVLLYSGKTTRITQKLPRPGPETVYNLEIWGEHVYCVGEDGVLVHNSCFPRYNGPKPKYTVNPAHVLGSRYVRGKTPIPSDAELVFKNAVPNDPVNPTAWFGKNKDGQIYRYGIDHNGNAHFNGIAGVGDGTRNITPYVYDRLKSVQ